MNIKPICPYCGKWSVLVTGETIYPHRPDLHNRRFYLCAPCNAYVGCHPGTDKALGTLADAALRVARSRAHSAFDPLWRNAPGNRGKARRESYKQLAAMMGIEYKDCHIAQFDIEQCRRVVELVERWRDNSEVTI